MRGTRWLVAILTVLLVGAACEPVATEPVANNTANTAAELTTNTAPANTNTAGTVESATAEIHPISIPALQALTLDGRDLKLGRVLANTAAYTRYYITYKSGALIISGIMNIPKGDGPFPVLFLNHGYIDTSVYTNGRGLKREQDYFARNGFAVLHSDYRCHADSDCPKSDPLAQRFGYANDVMNAIQAVKTANHPKLDTEQLGMLGHSMGGGVTQQIVVAKPDLIDAAVLYAPVSSDYKDSYERYTIRRPADAKKLWTPTAQPSNSRIFGTIFHRASFSKTFPCRRPTTTVRRTPMCPTPGPPPVLICSKRLVKP